MIDLTKTVSPNSKKNSSKKNNQTKLQHVNSRLDNIEKSISIIQESLKNPNTDDNSSIEGKENDIIKRRKKLMHKYGLT